MGEVVTETNEYDYLDAIFRSREAGMCWSAKSWREGELTKLTRLCLRKSASVQEIAADGRVDAIRISLASRSERVQSISSAVQYLDPHASAI